MKGKNFIVRPGGKLVRESHRFGGHGHGHDRYSRLCRDQILMAELNRDFAGQLSQLGDTVEIEEPVSTWTVLEPMSGRFRSTIFVIEGEEELAIRIYAARHGGRHPLKVSCDCGCGPDYHLVEVQGSLAGGPGQLGDWYVRVPARELDRARTKLQSSTIVEAVTPVDGVPGKD